MRNQPTPEMEEENAFYAWTKQCLAEHIVECCKGADFVGEKQAEEIAWTYERFRLAYERHREMENKRLGK